MFQLKLCIVAFFLSIGSVPDIMNAHPGRMDSNGCHVCRTNCEKWGLQNGEYHCHNGGSSSTSSYSQTTTPTAPSIDYASVGKQDGYNYKYQNPNVDADQIHYPYDNATYQSSFQEGFSKAAKELTDKSSEMGKTAGKADADKIDNYTSITVPDGVIVHIYQQDYKAAFETHHKDLLTEAVNAADQNAFSKIFDDQKSAYSIELTSIQMAYDDEYQAKLKSYAAEKKEILKTAAKKGKSDAENNSDKHYNFIKKYEGTKFYKEVKSVYNKAYDENTTEGGFFQSFISLLVILALFYFISKKVKSRKKKILCERS